MKTNTLTPSLPASISTLAPRIHGLDLARFLAVMGMVYSHLGEELDYEGFSRIFMESRNGLPSALFAVLAGISMSIISASAVRAGGATLAHNRHRLIIRGLILMVLGFILGEAQVSIAVVLLPLGLAMVLLSWAPRARNSTLISLGLTLLLVGPALQVLLPGAFLTSLMGGSYPLLAWLTYVTAGILLHRLLITPQVSTIALSCLLVVGALLTMLGLQARYLLGFIPLDPDSSVQYYTEEVIFESRFLVSEPAFVFLSPEGHSGGLMEQITSLFASLAALALCLLLCRFTWLNRLLYPLRAAGSMSLTVYVLHVLTTAWYFHGLGFTLLNPAADFDDYLQGKAPENDLLVILTVVVAATVAALWKLKFRRGPLEEWVARVIDTATRQDLPARELPDPSPATTPVGDLKPPAENPAEQLDSHGRELQPDIRK
ncbi:hypothetical protein COCCU_10280 [Corynebacterium occultum]|uniref:Uncharacterized protein n=1 Tax=Corynebacterium occultum TaxID=2675219 RepID=A0A6B8W9M7_9CORY|nr:DUF418 domain-containing protein [Corynebacterium occultum]QGU07975.1 hypothetical protein COCCU_10280 [Corynebacterium occultum]